MSPATVSRALRGLPHVNEETRRRVERAAADLLEARLEFAHLEYAAVGGVAESTERDEPADGEEDESPWPDLVMIDGGQGQLSAAQEALAAISAEL